MRKVSRTVNRVLLGLTGLFLIGVGGTVLLGGLDLPGKWGFGMPSGWRWSRPEDVLLRDADRTRWTGHGWWWPVVIAVLAVLVLLALWWLLAQFRRHRLGEILVDSGDDEGAHVRGRAMESVLTAESESLEGVERARVVLTGRRTEPRLRAGLALAPHAEPCAVVARLSSETIAHARTSAGLERLPAEVRLRAVKHRAERVS
ncbi:alkaline shock response membrane anchor protein AmaP [Streptomyces sp. NPDC018019]|uniref:alkaline shock response membrane anchor protein AmaP n=1 Tax=Streptomyces sp. NPDC018019 TaxID=3365030 RepID=UPI00379EC44C